MYGSDEVQDLQLLLQGLREVQIQMVHFLLPENIKKNISSMLKQRQLILKQDKIRLDFSANNSRKIQRSTPGGIILRHHYYLYNNKLPLALLNNFQECVASHILEHMTNKVR